jgi:hypothetical protein
MEQQLTADSAALDLLNKQFEASNSQLHATQLVLEQVLLFTP